MNDGRCGVKKEMRGEERKRDEKREENISEERRGGEEDRIGVKKEK